MDNVKPITSNSVSRSVLQRWSKVIENYQDKSFIKPSKKEAFAQMLETEMKHLPKILKENVGSASWMNTSGASALGQVPFYIGVIRRGFAKLIGMNLFGVQPLSQPGGVLFAVQRTYKGKVDKYTALKDVNKFNSRIIVMTASINGLAEGDAVQIKENITGTPVIADAIAAYVEGNVILVKVTAFHTGYDMTAIVGGGSSTGSIVVKGMASAYATLVTDNFQMFTYVFKNFSMFADASQSLNNDQFDGTNIREVGNDVITVPITNIKNRRIKSKISQEIIEDMQAYKYDIQNDLMNLMLQDITGEMNKEFYALMKGSADVFPSVNFGSLTGTTFDKYIQLIGKATNMSNKIAVDLKTAVGNYMVISPALLAAFQTLSKYWAYSNDPSAGNINLKTSDFATEPMVGKFNNMWDLYVDIFSDTDDILVGHYSENNMDNAWFYLPYIPLTPDILKDPATGQWVLHYRTRYATLENPYGSYRWIKKYTVTNFTI